MRILTISCNYPNPKDPNLGIFVQRRITPLASSTEIKVIAPVPILDYGNPSGHIFLPRNGSVPLSRTDGSLEVLHPRWLYPPFGGALNAFCLFACLLWPVSRLRREFPFEVIDTHFGYPEGIAGALLARVFRIPYTVTLRGSEILHAQYLFRRHWMSWALQKAGRIIAVSGNLHQLAVELGAQPAKIKTIANGIDSGIFFPRYREECRRKHQLPLDAYFLLSAGHLIELKGHHHVIRALRVLLDEGLAVHLIIAGGAGHYESALRKQVSELRLESSVRFLGEVPQETMAELMCASDVLCLASIREGCPNVVLEALACGCPVVATDVGAVPDLIPEDRFGFVVPPNDPRALKDALSRAFQQDWDRAAISRWGQSRSWQQVAREVFAELRALVPENTESGASRS